MGVDDMWGYPGRFRASLLAVLAAAPVFAQETAITDSLTAVEIVVNGETLRIARQAPEGTLCPPDCIQPMAPVRGIRAAGALEVLIFLQDEVAGGTGVLIDARMPDDHARGTLPGAVNVPFVTLDPANAYRNDILAALGAKPAGGDSFSFDGAVKVVIFCDGPASGDAAAAVRHLRTAGYPVDKMMFFRGGLQEWTALGLTHSDAAVIEGAALTAGGTP
jgi:rhodanese-related sulfurtransferase